MENIPMVDLATQYGRIKAEVHEAMQAVLDSTQYINGRIVNEFSKNLAAYLGVKHVLPCANGTDALQIALMALDLKPGDEVITTPFTFIATAEVIALLQLKPIFVDAAPRTFNINETEIAAAITEKTKCIIPVHLFGQGANMEKIQEIANKYGVVVVEDNAQSIGANFYFSDGKIQKLGTIGEIGTTSFFPSKNLGGYGDGGALFTNNDNLAAQIQMICNHGSQERYYHRVVGVNSRLDSLQAAVLNVKLNHLDGYNHARQQAADFYDESLRGVAGVEIPQRATYSDHVFHQYTILIEKNRDKVKSALDKAGIPTGVYYPVPLHLQAAYANLGYKEGDFPVSEQLSKQVLSLPMHSEMTESVQSKIITTLKIALSEI